MRVLTEVELAECRAHLEVIHAIQKEVKTRHDYAHSAQFELEFSDVEKLTYLSITKGILNALEGEVIKLTEKLELDETLPPSDQLVQVIELFDGNRRMHKP